jgi:hypothetical protein
MYHTPTRHSGHGIPGRGGPYHVPAQDWQYGQGREHHSALQPGVNIESVSAARREECFTIFGFCLCLFALFLRSPVPRTKIASAFTDSSSEHSEGYMRPHHHGAPVHHHQKHDQGGSEIDRLVQSHKNLRDANFIGNWVDQVSC